MARTSQFQHAGKGCHDSCPHVDVIVTWCGSKRLRQQAFSELSAESLPRSAGRGRWMFNGVKAETAFRWLIRHLWESDIESPRWVRVWVGEWLIQRGKELML